MPSGNGRGITYQLSQLITSRRGTPRLSVPHGDTASPRPRHHHTLLGSLNCWVETRHGSQPQAVLGTRQLWSVDLGWLHPVAPWLPWLSTLTMAVPTNKSNRKTSRTATGVWHGWKPAITPAEQPPNWSCFVCTKMLKSFRNAANWKCKSFR